MPCDECIGEFGAHLRATDGPVMTAAAQAARGQETQRSYALQIAAGDPVLVAAARAHYGLKADAAPIRKGQPALLVVQRASHVYQARARLGMQQLPRGPLMSSEAGSRTDHDDDGLKTAAVRRERVGEAYHS
ncbi:hypothetical protein [Mycobacterium xenopi]|uniref:hypothetical protein n=1 Tax=Mycobacterium xenopi TaxID=1789 RepID=UPI000DA104CD|nr:hypothetical protein [Mycobacterium xenopi]SPX94955.1 Uncharacterised protein [Mycobacterium xenopi]